MEKYRKIQTKQNAVNFRLIISLLAVLSVASLVIFVSLLAASEKVDQSKKNNTLQQDKGNEEIKIENKDQNSEMVAVVKEINTEDQYLTLLDTATNEYIDLYYLGGSDVTDKFGQVIAMNQIVVGMMVDVGYDKKDSNIVKLQISTKAWEYIGVNNLSIDRTAKVMKIVQTKYKYTDDLLILDGSSFIRVNDLAEQDELTIRGYDQVIWSITVTRGHGTVKMVDYETFLGGNVTVGHEAIQQITDEMTITVREGNFNITVENGDYSGTKNITIKRNEETIVSLGDLGPEVGMIGKINFQITPFGADLLIDGELASYSDPIELEYGEHQINVTLGGFTSYTGSVEVNEAGKTIRIDLPEDTSKEEATITITDDANVEDDNNQATENGEDTVDNGVTGETETKEEDIVDKSHFIYVQNPTGASVYLNGEFKVISPGSFEKIIGTHVITFIKDGYETKSYTVEVVDDDLDTYFSLPDMLILGSEEE